MASLVSASSCSTKPRGFTLQCVVSRTEQNQKTTLMISQSPISTHLAQGFKKLLYQCYILGKELRHSAETRYFNPWSFFLNWNASHFIGLPLIPNFNRQTITASTESLLYLSHIHHKAANCPSLNTVWKARHFMDNHLDHQHMTEHITCLASCPLVFAAQSLNLYF